MKHKLFSKRGLALVVSLMMCLSAMSTTAWAGNFTQLQDKIDTAEDGSLTLEEDYTYNQETDGDRNTITIDEKFTLDLGGHKIDGNENNKSVITVTDGGNLTLEDTSEAQTGTITGGTGSSSEHGTEGGGVIVKNGGKFTMDGGTISGNTVEGRGGGVYVENGGEFTMNDGAIRENSVTGPDGTSDSQGTGGGVAVWGGGKFTMNGGTITENSAVSGGGVYMCNRVFGDEVGSTFVMNDGKIIGNSSTAADKDIQIDGAESSLVTINHGTISKEDAMKHVGDYGYGNDGTTDTNVTIHKQPDTGAKWNSDAEGHWHACEGGTDCDGKLDFEPHVFGAVEVVKAATCTEKGLQCQTCSECGYIKNESIPMVAHDLEQVTDREATCEEEGAQHRQCKKCGYEEPTSEIPPLDHAYGDWTNMGESGHQRVCGNDPAHVENEDHAWGEWTTNADGSRTHSCSVCGATDSAPVDPTPGGDGDNTGDTDTEDPGTVTIPEVDPPLDDAPAPAAVTIADEDVPLAGLVTLAQLLDELYRHEGAPEVVLPEDFPFAEHEYAVAICWGLDNALVFHTEAEPLNPDEIVTVVLMREVLTNFVAYRGVEEFTVELAGEDDEIVMDLGERLVVFYAQLAEAEAAAESDEAEAA